MERPASVWSGTDADLASLRDAIAHNCGCDPNGNTCQAHRMLTDKYTLDHLAFVKTIAYRISYREFHTEGTQPAL